MAPTRSSCDHRPQRGRHGERGPLDRTFLMPRPVGVAEYEALSNEAHSSWNRWSRAES